MTQRRLATGWLLGSIAGVPLAIAAGPVVEPGVAFVTQAAVDHNGTVPVAQRYDPVTNPTGVRCTVYDHTANVYGRDPATGFARRPLDNVGIQYGLKLVNNGQISVQARNHLKSGGLPGEGA